MPPLCARPYFEHPLLTTQEEFQIPIFYFLETSSSVLLGPQKVNFRSGGERVQIIERNPTDRIYKAAETRKAVLLQCVSSPSSEFSLLIS